MSSSVFINGLFILPVWQEYAPERVSVHTFFSHKCLSIPQNIAELSITEEFCMFRVGKDIYTCTMKKLSSFAGKWTDGTPNREFGTQEFDEYFKWRMRITW